MAITLGTNIQSLRAQRQLFNTGETLGTVFERLSSGQRINRASDDAAGLAIASSLNADSRVFTQAIRNANDGLSMLTIGDGALSELTEITIRLSELAEQSANGTFSDVQRLSLHEVGLALVDEYNRIVESTKFGSKDLFRVEDLNTRLQLGYGLDGSLEVSLGEDLARQAGDGTFQAIQSVSGIDGTAVDDLGAADFNGDGNIDLVTSGFAGAHYVQLGNGDGTFGAFTGYAGAGRFNAIADINGDGVLDLVGHGSSGVDDLQVLLGNGDGTFQAIISNDLLDVADNLTVGDINGDQKVDIAIARDGSISIALGNGDGSFQAEQTVATGFVDLNDIVLGDVNGDSILDIAVADYDANKVAFLTGDGTGSFQATATYIFNKATHVRLGDFDGDSILDFAATAVGATKSIVIGTGNGDGTFGDISTITTHIARRGPDLQTGDVNGDGILDLVHATGEFDYELKVFLGNGDGSFANSATLDSGGSKNSSIQLVDINNDGAIDILNENRVSRTVSIHYGNVRDLVTILDFDLRTEDSSRAAMAEIVEVRDRILEERSTIGAQVSRVSVAMANLQTARENYTSAESQILDADVAEESSKLLRNNILQQAASAVLAQANQQPALSLQLLG